MAKISIKKCFKFEASHRLLGHQSKCINIHGHNYHVWVYTRADKLDSLGMVFDFADLKEGIGNWLDVHWDHAIIYKEGDTEVEKMFEHTTFKKFKFKYNPTAENMALYLLEICSSLYKESDIEVFKVEVYENLESIAIAELD